MSQRFFALAKSRGVIRVELGKGEAMTSVLLKRKGEFSGEIIGDGDWELKSN